MRNNHWYAVRSQSLAIYARNAGFDLAVYHDYSDGAKEELRKRAVNEALDAIYLACNEQGFDVYSVKRGVYVIALSNPLSVRYSKYRSQVIYIGMGNIMGRIKLHFSNRLFDFMLSVAGANFDFHFARPALPGTAMYYKQVEHNMLKYFHDQYGGLYEKRRYPILNRNAGINMKYPGGTDWWKRPLKASGRRPLWELTPTKFGDFPPL
ncbi:MAG: hypothetical protein WD904_01995 [Dehalococcoidia bacterium]